MTGRAATKNPTDPIFVHETAASGMVRILSPNVTRCIFCEGRDPTKEHVFSRWTHRLLPPRKPGKTISRVGAVYADHDETKLVKLPGALQDWQVKCICAACNNGWMSRLERLGKPILTPLIQGHEIRLFPRDQRIITAWAALKVMIAVHWQHGSVTVHWMQRRRMMKRQLPPANGWAIWIGHYERLDRSPRWLSQRFFIPSPEAPARVPTHYNGASTTLVVGKLFIQIIHGPVQFRVTSWRFTHKGTLYRIWPLQPASIKWPGSALNDRDAENIANGAQVFFKRAAADTVERARNP